jgi:hypothetical protein
MRGLWADIWLRSILVLAMGGFYFWTAVPEWRAGMIGRSGGGYYNLLMRGFMKGTLSLDLPADPFLAQIPNPSDPSQRGDHGLHDASYYRGRYYLYFGAAPVALLFLPFHIATGRYVDETVACPFFAVAGLLASVWLLSAVRRRYFPRSPWWVAAGCVLALGLADLMPVLLRRANVWEVPITCAYACFMAGLCGLFQALHGGRSARWLAFASTAFGLAVASRPTYLFGCGAILVPVVALAWERRGQGSVFGDPTLRRLAAAGILPLAAIGILMALYNLGRFGSPFDFGFRHLMNGEPVWKEDLFGLRFFWYNVRVYALAPARWSPYFPFVSIARLPVAPAGHLGSEDPFGIIPNIPFALLALAALAFSVRRDAWPPRLRWLCLAIAVAVSGTGLATSSFGGAINRYEVDFLPGIILLACIGWLGLADLGLRRAIRILAGALVSLALAYSVLFNVLASFRHNELFREEHPAMYARMVHAWNRIPQAVDDVLGTRYGPVELQVIFPEDKTGRSEPLVVTGFSFLSDYLTVHYDGPGRVSFALQHSAYGNFSGPSIPAAPGVVHTLKVEMGSLYPPPSHPYFDRLTAAEGELCQKTLSVTLDGKVALQRDLPFFDASSHSPSIGNSGERSGFKDAFSGRIVSMRRLPVDLIEPAVGPVNLSVVFPAFTGIRNEPLLSTGRMGLGDLLYVRYEGPDSVSFGVDHWVHGSKRSAPIHVDYSATHLIEIVSDVLEGSHGRNGTERAGRFVMRIDGKTVFCEQAPYSAAALETVTAGVNSIGYSSATGMFRGQMFETRGNSRGTQPGPEEEYGPVDLEFRMPAGMAQAQPLVTTGKPGAGDALFIRWSGPGRIRLGYDHWGSGLVESNDIAVVPDSEHRWSIEIPSLLPPGVTPEAVFIRQSLVVLLDGNLVWARRVLSNPALPSEAYVGSNGIGASTCEHDFSGGVAWFERRPKVPLKSEEGAAVALSLVLPTGRGGFREPLVTLGGTGHADVINIKYLDERHVSFGIDHWGASYSESAPVEVDYHRIHTIEMRIPALGSRDAAPEAWGDAWVRLDGIVVWRVSQRFYTTTAPPVFGLNRIGASTCEEEFSGELVGVARK